MLKLKLQDFGHLMRRVDSLEQTTQYCQYGSCQDHIIEQKIQTLICIELFSLEVAETVYGHFV